MCIFFEKHYFNLIFLTRLFVIIMIPVNTQYDLQNKRRSWVQIEGTVCRDNISWLVFSLVFWPYLFEIVFYSLQLWAYYTLFNFSTRNAQKQPLYFFVFIDTLLVLQQKIDSGPFSRRSTFFGACFETAIPAVVHAVVIFGRFESKNEALL